MNSELTPKLSIRLYTDEKCFGPGVAQLLIRVEKHGSLRAAAISMGMAYSKAWTVIKRCEDALGFKLLNMATGGSHGGGASLTPEGKSMLEKYTEFCNDVNTYAGRAFEETFADMIGDDTDEQKNE